MGGPFGGRQQTSPLGSPQPLPSPGNPANEMAVSTFSNVNNVTRIRFEIDI